MNPWLEIDLNDYENHMKLDSVFQLQTMNKIMGEQLYEYPVSSVMILGIAGGNGLNQVKKDRLHIVYGVDINNEYLNVCEERYSYLSELFIGIQADLSSEACELPNVDLVIANLLVEYIGCDIFARRILQIHPEYVSVVLQINKDDSFVSDSPYLKVFDRLDEVLHKTDEVNVSLAMINMGYDVILKKEEQLPNGKIFLRLDYKKIN